MTLTTTPITEGRDMTATKTTAETGYRDELRRRHAALPALRAKRAEAQAKADAATRRLDEVRATIVAEVKALLAERDELDREIAVATRAESDLLTTCRDQSLLAEERRIGQERLQLEDRIPRLAEAVRQNEREAKFCHEQSVRCVLPPDKAEYTRRAEEYDARAATRRGEIDAVQVRRSELEAEQKEIDRRKLLA